MNHIPPELILAAQDVTRVGRGPGAPQGGPVGGLGNIIQNLFLAAREGSLLPLPNMGTPQKMWRPEILGLLAAMLSVAEPGPGEFKAELGAFIKHIKRLSSKELEGTAKSLDAAINKSIKETYSRQAAGLKVSHERSPQEFLDYAKRDAVQREIVRRKPPPTTEYEFPPEFFGRPQKAYTPEDIKRNALQQLTDLIAGRVYDAERLLKKP